MSEAQHRIGDYEVRHQEAEQKLREIGRLMKDTLPMGWGFAHFLYTYGEGGTFFYIASCEREDMINLLQEFLVKLKGN